MYKVYECVGLKGTSLKSTIYHNMQMRVQDEQLMISIKRDKKVK